MARKIAGKVVYSRRGGKHTWTARKGRNKVANDANQRYENRLDCENGLRVTAEILNAEIARLDKLSERPPGAGSKRG